MAGAVGVCAGQPEEADGHAGVSRLAEPAAEHSVSAHRISQGAGIMLRTDAGIERLVRPGADL
jgi:hypothetical protein